MRNAIGCWLLLIALLVPHDALAGKRLRVLFVGNSLTYYNDLPATFASLYRVTEPGTEVATEMLATGSGTLRERIAEGRLAALLRDQRFDLVVLQEKGGWPVCMAGGGDKGCEDSPHALREAVNLIRANGAQTLWLATYQKLPEAQRALSAESHRLATAIPVEMVDVGAAMQKVAPAVRKRLLLKDGHPDVAGTWLTAAVLVGATSDHPLPKAVPPRSCGSQWRGGRLTASQPASQQRRGVARQCHAVDATLWRAIRNAVDG
jgi:hypothetical protein